MGTTGNVGRNFRLLRMAKAITLDPDSFVHVIGSDDDGLPKDIENAENFRFWRIPNYSGVFPFHVLFAVLWFFWRLVQFVVCFIGIQKADFVVCSTRDSIFDPVLFYIAKVILRAKLVIDVAPFDFIEAVRCGHRDSDAVRKALSIRIPRLGDTRIVSTRAMQVTLQLRSLTSTLIRDPPGTQFGPRPEMRNEVCELLGVDRHTMIIAVPVPELTAESMTQFMNIIGSIDAMTPATIAVVAFCGGKLKAGIEKIIKEHELRKIKLFVFPMHSDIYANILGVSDLGICFNVSVHGLDISSHLNEMAASGVPIIAFRYGCVREVIHEGENGLLFWSDEDLLKIMRQILVEKSINIMELKENARKFNSPTNADWFAIFRQKSKSD